MTFGTTLTLNSVKRIERASLKRLHTLESSLCVLGDAAADLDRFLPCRQRLWLGDTLVFLLAPENHRILVKGSRVTGIPVTPHPHNTNRAL